MSAQNSSSITAVLICNTGSPSAPTKEAVKKYLAEFLSDRRVVEMHPLLWQPILRCIILPRRSQASADRYKGVWTENGSPLVRTTELTALRMQQLLGDDFLVEWAMCYGVRRIDEVLPKLLERRPARIVVLPLFAQYATQTTEAVFDAVRRVQKAHSDMPPVLAVSQYFDDSDYIQALAERVRAHWEKTGGLGAHGRLMTSFHGIPAASSERGDPYEAQCERTAEALRIALGLKPEQLVRVFQSKFGRAKWLEPSAVDTARALGKDGLDRLDVICPGFASDCLETLEEIAVELKGIYEGGGGSGFHYIECLNAAEDAAKLYAGIVKRRLAESCQNGEKAGRG